MSNTNVDNAITLILYHNATQNNITNMLNWAGYTGAGSNECSVMYDYSDGYLNTGYLSTPGQKTTAGCNITDYHIRQYGSYYDPNWGYFAIASTHKDYSDGSGCSGSDYGYQEEAEHHIGNDLWNANNCGAFSPPCVNAIYWDSNSGRALNNAEDGTQCGDRTYGYGWRPDTSHCEQSDGYASTLDVH